MGKDLENGEKQEDVILKYKHIVGQNETFQDKLRMEIQNESRDFDRTVLLVLRCICDMQQCTPVSSCIHLSILILYIKQLYCLHYCRGGIVSRNRT